MYRLWTESDSSQADGALTSCLFREYLTDQHRFLLTDLRNPARKREQCWPFHRQLLANTRFFHEKYIILYLSLPKVSKRRFTNVVYEPILLRY